MSNDSRKRNVDEESSCASLADCCRRVIWGTFAEASSFCNFSASDVMGAPSPAPSHRAREPIKVKPKQMQNRRAVGRPNLAVCLHNIVTQGSVQRHEFTCEKSARAQAQQNSSTRRSDHRVLGFRDPLNDVPLEELLADVRQFLAAGVIRIHKTQGARNTSRRSPQAVS